MKIIADKPPSRYPSHDHAMTFPANLSGGNVNLEPIKTDITTLQGNVTNLQAKDVQHDQKDKDLEKLAFLEGGFL